MAADAVDVPLLRPGLQDPGHQGDAGTAPLGQESHYDDYAMRWAAIMYRTPYLTTMPATSAACDALIALKSRRHSVRSIQERIASLTPSSG